MAKSGARRTDVLGRDSETKGATWRNPSGIHWHAPNRFLTEQVSLWARDILV